MLTTTFRKHIRFVRNASSFFGPFAPHLRELQSMAEFSEAESLLFKKKGVTSLRLLQHASQIIGSSLGQDHPFYTTCNLVQAKILTSTHRYADALDIFESTPLDRLPPELRFHAKWVKNNVRLYNGKKDVHKVLKENLFAMERLEDELKYSITLRKRTNSLIGVATCYQNLCETPNSEFMWLLNDTDDAAAQEEEEEEGGIVSAACRISGSDAWEEGFDFLQNAARLGQTRRDMMIGLCNLGTYCLMSPFGTTEEAIGYYEEGLELFQFMNIEVVRAMEEDEEEAAAEAGSSTSNGKKEGHSLAEVRDILYSQSKDALSTPFSYRDDNEVSHPDDNQSQQEEKASSIEDYLDRTHKDGTKVNNNNDSSSPSSPITDDKHTQQKKASTESKVRKVTSFGMIQRECEDVYLTLLSNLGEVLIREGDLEACEEILSKGLSIEETDYNMLHLARFLSTLAYLYQLKHQPVMAEGLYRRCLDLLDQHDSFLAQDEYQQQSKDQATLLSLFYNRDDYAYTSLTLRCQIYRKYAALLAKWENREREEEKFTVLFQDMINNQVIPDYNHINTSGLPSHVIHSQDESNPLPHTLPPYISYDFWFNEL